MKIIEIIESAADSFHQTLKGTSASNKVKKPSTLSTLGKSIKSGYKNTQDLQQKLKYGPVGKTLKNISQFAKQIQRGPKS